MYRLSSWLFLIPSTSIIRDSLGLSLVIGIVSLWMAILAVSTSPHAQVYRRCSRILSPLFHLYTRVFADTLGDDPIRISFFPKTSEGPARG